MMRRKVASSTPPPSGQISCSMMLISSLDMRSCAAKGQNASAKHQDCDYKVDSNSVAMLALHLALHRCTEHLHRCVQQVFSTSRSESLL